MTSKKTPILFAHDARARELVGGGDLYLYNYKTKLETLRCIGQLLITMETNTLKLQFKLERETKNNLRFSEQIVDRWDMPTLTTIYVSKHALKALNYCEGDTLEVTLRAVHQNN